MNKKGIYGWIKDRIEYRRRLSALWLACRYGSNNDRAKAVEKLEQAVMRCAHPKTYFNT